MQVDFIHNGQASGSVAQVLLNNDFDVGALRPWIGKKGRSYITRRIWNERKEKWEEKNIVTNAPATLRRDEWMMFDNTILEVQKQRLRFVGDLRGQGLTLTIPDGFGVTMLEYQTMGDITPATISMDPVRHSERDRPQFDVGNLPLPCIHKDLDFTARQIATSRRKGTPIDTLSLRMSARRVVEEVEKLAIGISSSYSYGGATVYGLINHPDRNLQTLDDPAGGTWVASDTLTDILQMREKLQNDNYFGPYVLYTSPAWDLYLDDDYSDAKGDNTLRQRILALPDILAVRRLDYLTGKRLILVQMTEDVIREVIGMEMQTIQWPTEGGMRLNYKIVTIQVPQVRSDPNGNSGIVDGTV